jgi:ribosomal protein S18 acetylase RimI-like enzyme
LTDYGFAVAIGKTIGFIFYYIYYTKIYRIYMIELKNYQPKEKSNGEFQYRLIGCDDASIVKKIEGMEEWLRGKVADLLRKGALCLVAFKNEEVAGFNLATFGEVEMPLIKTKRKFREGDAWSIQITVDSKYRGRGLGSELRYRMFSELKKRRIKKFYGGTLRGNVANLKLSRKVGLREISDIEYIGILGWKRWNVRKVE